MKGASGLKSSKPSLNTARDLYTDDLGHLFGIGCLEFGDTAECSWDNAVWVVFVLLQRWVHNNSWEPAGRRQLLLSRSRCL
jgi:hypothetical protein